MSDLDLKLLDDDDNTTDRGPGRYADKRAFDVLQRYLGSKLSTSEAAKEITAMLPGTGDRKTRTSEIGHFGSFLCQMAEQIPYHHPAQTRLVQLIQHVSQSPKLNGQGNNDGYMFCFTMNDFKSQLRNWFTPYLEDGSENTDQYSHALNFSAFLARLTQCGFLSYPPFSVWTMRGSLEEKIDHQEAFDYSVSSAALWIVFAGQALFTQVVEVPLSEKPESYYNQGTLYHGPKLGLERWRFWKEALTVAVERKDASEECRNLARGAADLMDSIEQNMGFF